MSDADRKKIATNAYENGIAAGWHRMLCAAISTLREAESLADQCEDKYRRDETGTWRRHIEQFRDDWLGD